MLKMNPSFQKINKLSIFLFLILTSILILSLFLLRSFNLLTIIFGTIFLFFPNLLLILGVSLLIFPRISTIWMKEGQLLKIREQCHFHNVSLTVDLDKLEKIVIPIKTGFMSIFSRTGRIEFWYSGKKLPIPNGVTYSIPKKDPLFQISCFIGFLEDYPNVQIIFKAPLLQKFSKSKYFIQKFDFKTSDWIIQRESFVSALPTIQNSSQKTLSSFFKEFNILPHYFEMNIKKDLSFNLRGINQRTKILFKNSTLLRTYYFLLLFSGILLTLGLTAILLVVVFPDSPILPSLFVPGERKHLDYPHIYYVLYGFLYIILGITTSYPFLSRILGSKLPVIQFDPYFLRIGRKSRRKITKWELELSYSIITDMKIKKSHNDPTIMIINLKTVLGEFPVLEISQDELIQADMEFRLLFAYYNEFFLKEKIVRV